MAQESVEQEIKWLETQLEAKRKEASEGGEARHEREMVKESIKEAAKEPQAGPPSGPPPASLTDDEAQQHANELREKEHEETVDELVAVAFSKGLMSAVKIAESLKNPHLLDDFHDALADKYYEKLLESRKVAK